MRRSKTPPALLNRSPGNKESGFWTERCRQEEGNLHTGTVELPWLEAAAQRSTLGASMTQRTLLQQPPSIPATTWIHSHDKVVQRCQHTHRPGKHTGMPTAEGNHHATQPLAGSRSVLLPPGCCSTGFSSTLTPSTSYLTPAERYLPLGSPSLRSGGAAATGPAHPRSPTIPTSGGSTHSAPGTVAAATQRRRNAELQQRIAAVQSQLEEERQRTDCARKALHAATHRSVTCAETAIWHPRESTT